ncbi:hypothetical protein M9Y10_028764 [Tritrichomonas musculus]|uniref:Serine/threonine-protein phosphatase n=1 Tax=Tritrichomonas musculus TaxID=1915356 RepID=A0ABR2KKE1_9EUKA
MNSIFTSLSFHSLIVIQMETSQIRQTILSILTSRMHGRNSQTSFQSDETIIKIIKTAQKILQSESSLLELHGNFTVVGDIHGNIDDLLRIFERRGYPPTTNYLFLGDYVDRGAHSPEVIILLLCLKILYPTSLYMIRGNHECESVTSVYGFKRDCSRRFGPSMYSDYNIPGIANKVYRKFMKCFMHLPYAAVINDAYFCVHGGISPYLKSLKDISELIKPMISADSELASDMVWSDPLESSKGFQPSDRGTGYFFNDKKLNVFLNENGLKKLIRSHESCMDGVDFPLDNCITIFSNTDYCGMNNRAAVLVIDQDSDESSSSPSVSNSSEEYDDSDDENTIIISESNNYENNCIKVERFDPLTDEDFEKRRVIIPEWMFTDITEKEVIKDDPCPISPQELLDALSGPPINLF